MLERRRDQCDMTVVTSLQHAFLCFSRLVCSFCFPLLYCLSYLWLGFSIEHKGTRTPVVQAELRSQWFGKYRCVLFLYRTRYIPSLFLPMIVLDPPKQPHAIYVTYISLSATARRLLPHRRQMQTSHPQHPIKSPCLPLHPSFSSTINVLYM